MKFYRVGIALSKLRQKTSGWCCWCSRIL